MDKIIIYLLFGLLLSSCINNKSLKGEWITTDINRTRIIKFWDDKYTEVYPNTLDTFEIPLIHKYVYFDGNKNILLQDDTLKFWDIYDTISFVKYENEKLSDWLLGKIDSDLTLPKGVGKEIKIEQHPNVIHLEYVSEDSVNLYHNGVLTSFEAFDVDEYTDDYLYRTILLIDRDIKFKYVEILFDLLRAYRLNRTTHLVSSFNKNQNHCLIGINKVLPYLYSGFWFGRHDADVMPTLREPLLPPPPPPPPAPIPRITFDSIYVLRNGIVNVDSELIDSLTFANIYIRELRKNPKKVWFLYVDSNSTYQSYINFLDLVYTNCYNERERLSMERYNLKYKFLSDSIRKVVRRKFPIRIWRLNNWEFEDVKENGFREAILSM